MKNHTLLTFLLSVGVAGFAGCSSLKVEKEFDSKASFSRYKTYSWLPAARAPASGSAGGYTSLTEHRAKNAIESELVKHGLQKAGPEQKPDLYVAFDSRTAEWYRSDPWRGTGYGYGYGYGSWGAFGSPVVWGPEFESTFQITLLDPDTKQAVWQGVARNTNDDRLIDQETIDKAVKEVLAEYPPKSER